ncbi:hypothetical protein KQX54_018714 [Cotesia glomerata]|uniref:Uncharacterized protein n=1 Tax=Cotesia glomerata TaxID=32391 RepID=A0AAV7IU31_COTGL|nr:hypothetical protein KQX54_018714 [Cotesia glomerata]
MNSDINTGDTKTSFLWALRKADIIAELAKRSIEVDPSETVAELRLILRDHLVSLRNAQGSRANSVADLVNDIDNAEIVGDRDAKQTTDPNVVIAQETDPDQSTPTLRRSSRIDTNSHTVSDNSEDYSETEEIEELRRLEKDVKEKTAQLQEEKREEAEVRRETEDRLRAEFEKQQRLKQKQEIRLAREKQIAELREKLTSLSDRQSVRDESREILTDNSTELRSLISQELWKFIQAHGLYTNFEPIQQTATVTDGREVSCVGIVNVKLRVKDRDRKLPFFIMPDFYGDMLFGVDNLGTLNFSIKLDPETGKMRHAITGREGLKRIKASKVKRKVRVESEVKKKEKEIEERPAKAPTTPEERLARLKTRAIKRKRLEDSMAMDLDDVVVPPKKPAPATKKSAVSPTVDHHHRGGWQAEQPSVNPKPRRPAVMLRQSAPASGRTAKVLEKPIAPREMQRAAIRSVQEQVRTRITMIVPATSTSTEIEAPRLHLIEPSPPVLEYQPTSIHQLQSAPSTPRPEYPLGPTLTLTLTSTPHGQKNKKKRYLERGEDGKMYQVEERGGRIIKTEKPSKTIPSNPKHRKVVEKPTSTT